MGVWCTARDTSVGLLILPMLLTYRLGASNNLVRWLRMLGRPMGSLTVALVHGRASPPLTENHKRTRPLVRRTNQGMIESYSERGAGKNR